MKRALIVGITEYDAQDRLPGAVADVRNVKKLLSVNEDDSQNFECLPISSETSRITVSTLRPQLEKLFQQPAQVALFYFSGHGSISFTGGAIAVQDSTRNDPGISMESIVEMANESQCEQAVIILDCCHSAATGSSRHGQKSVIKLREGVSMLAATREFQEAVETNSGGLFTGLMCEALKGGAADLTGSVNVAGVYSYVDRIFGAWGQRPMFKSHVSSLTPLRQCKPAIPLTILRKITSYFPKPEFIFRLDPSFEPTSPAPDPKNTATFDELQTFCRNGLVTPDDEKHMYYAAMNSKSCSLTPLGQFYWRLAAKHKE